MEIKSDKQRIIELQEELNKMKQKFDTLNQFVEEELGLNFKATPCASPVNYCDNCKCGKKERMENLK